MFNVLSELGIFLQHMLCGLLEKTCSAPTQTWGAYVTPMGASQAQGPSAWSQIVLWGQQRNNPFTPATRPAQGGIVVVGQALGLFHQVVTIAKLQRRNGAQSTLVCHRPGGACTGPGPSEGVWDPGQLCGGLILLPGPRETPTATALQFESRTRPQARASFSPGFAVLSRSREWHEPKPYE